MGENLTKLPEDLPPPKDDGLCDHLLGKIIPSITLQSSVRDSLDISNVKGKFVILYFFPMMVIPGKNLPTNWNDIPGARGCTPQNITINEHRKDLQKYDAESIGISTQSIEELIELTSLRKLSQPLISDSKLQFKEKLNIPTFDVENKIMYKRLTLIIQESKIIKVFYPVFPPDKHIFEILEWFENNSKNE